MKRRFLVGLWGLAMGLVPGWSQDLNSLQTMALSPTTVSEYFIACPFLTYTEGSGQRREYWLQLSAEQPRDEREANYLAKQLLLQGLSLDLRHPVRDLVVDQKNGYLHLAFEFEALTLVYFERGDKSRVVALRLEDRGQRDLESQWRFYNVRGNQWEPLAEDQILPVGWSKAYVPGHPTAYESDALILTRWDIDLPRYGTTAHLIPQPFSTDSDGPNVMVTIPGTGRQTNYQAYYTWFYKVFADASSQVKPLELKWNKAQGRFDAGKVAPWSRPKPSERPPRSVDQVFHHPANVWEYFLADPELQSEGDEGLYWSPQEVESNSQLLRKQDLLLYGGLGSTYPTDKDPTVIDVPGDYLHFHLEKRGPHPDGVKSSVVMAERTFTMVVLPGGHSPVILYRFWGTNVVGDTPSPRHELDRIAARFYEFPASGFNPLADEALFPLTYVDRLPLAGASAEDRVLQASVIWDVLLPRSGTTIQLIPWELADRDPWERQPLLAAFGSMAAAQKAFAAFVERWYTDHAVTLDWDSQNREFQGARLEPRRP